MGPGKDTVCQTKRLLGRTSEGSMKSSWSSFQMLQPFETARANYF